MRLGYAQSRVRDAGFLWVRAWKSDEILCCDKVKVSSSKCVSALISCKRAHHIIAYILHDSLYAHVNRNTCVQRVLCASAIGMAL